MKRNLLVATIGCVLMVLVMQWQGSGLKNEVAPAGIVDLELANSPARVQELLAHWEPTTVKTNIWLDFVFIVAYVLFFSVAAEQTALRWPDGGTGAKLGLLFARAAYVAGSFDIAENLLMLQTVGGNFTGTSLQLTFYCALLKFMLIGIILLYLIISLPVIIRKK